MVIARPIQKQAYCWFGWVYRRKASRWVRAARNIAWGPTRKVSIDEARYGNMKWTFKSGKWYACHNTIHQTLPSPSNIMTFLLWFRWFAWGRGKKIPVGWAELKYRTMGFVYKLRAWLALDDREVNRSNGVMQSKRGPSMLLGWVGAITEGNGQLSNIFRAWSKQDFLTSSTAYNTDPPQQGNPTLHQPIEIADL